MDTSERRVAPESPAGREREGLAAAIPLESWSAHLWKDGVQLDELPALESIAVQTRNTLYEMVVVDGPQGEVLVTGGRFFPVQTRARVNGCTLGGSCLKWRGIYPGFLLELQIGSELVITTRVRAVERRSTTRAD